MKKRTNIIPSFFLKLLKVPEFGVIGSTIVVAVFFSVLAPTLFLAPQNIGGIMTVAAQLGIVATGSAYLLISGEFDLSVGANFGVAAMLMGTLINWGVPAFVALLAALGLSSFIGLINGLVVVKVRVPSFITTLGMLFFLRAFALFLTQGYPVIVRGEHSILYWLNGVISRDFRTCSVWFIISAIVFWIVLNKTRYGNWTFATGGHKEVAREMGIPVTRVKILNFAVTGCLAGLGGTIFLGRFHECLSTTGEGMELEAIASAVIGAVSLYGGYGSTIGAAMGAIMISMTKIGLILIGAPPFWYRGFVGIVLIIASIINLWVFAKR